MKHKISVGVCIVLIILTIGFIFNNSRKPVEESNKSSEIVADKITQAVENKDNFITTFFQNIVVDNVRKTAHAVEFFVLGIEISTLSFILKKKFKPQSLWNILTAALVVAVADESIQILSARGPKVRDILIDFCGAVAGFLLALLIKFIITSFKGSKKYGKN